MRRVVRIQALVCRGLREHLDHEGFVEILPPIIGPVTDPGIRGALQVGFSYYGKTYKVMSSAILYKQMMASSLDRIYIMSPNVRLEMMETVKTKRHLTEFVQADVELSNVDYTKAMGLAEELLVSVCSYVKQQDKGDLVALNPAFEVPLKPFARISYDEAIDRLRVAGYELSYGNELPWDSEEVLSSMFTQPFFIYDYPLSARGFYDREDPSRPGILRDFDLMYPLGYGEAASGGEREFEYDKVVTRMKRAGQRPEDYGWYLDMLREGVKPSAGFGVGIERLTRFICGLDAIWEARPYPKVAGVHSP